MAKTFDIIEVVGISTESISDAIKAAVEENNEDNSISWFNIIEQRGRVLQDGKIEYQVTMKIGKKV